MYFTFALDNMECLSQCPDITTGNIEYWLYGSEKPISPDDNITVPDTDGDGVPDDVDKDPYNPDILDECTPLTMTTRQHLLNIPHAQCYLYSDNLNHALLDKTYIYTSANYDTCRDGCLVDFQYCDKYMSVKNGECIDYDGGKSECAGSLECEISGVGIQSFEHSSYGCIQKCYCIENSTQEWDSSTLQSSVPVSCQDDLKQEEELKDIPENLYEHNTTDNLDDFEENDSDPLSDSNATSNYSDAKSFRDALESYNASKEETNLKQLDKLVELSKINDDTRKILNDYKTANHNNLQDLKTKLTDIYYDNKHQTSEIVSSNNAIRNSVNSVSNKLSSVDDELDNITTNTNLLNDKLIDTNTKLNDGLFTDDNPFIDLNYSDGSQSFGSFQTNLTNSLNILEESNIFGLHGTSYSLPTYQATLSGGDVITIFEPSMLDGLPLLDIRNLVMFIFALMGFIHTFRST